MASQICTVIQNFVNLATVQDGWIVVPVSIVKTLINYGRQDLVSSCNSSNNPLVEYSAVLR